MRVMVLGKAIEDGGNGAAADLAEFMTPDELAAPRDGERGKLGVA